MRRIAKDCFDMFLRLVLSTIDKKCLITPRKMDKRSGAPDRHSYGNNVKNKNNTGHKVKNSKNNKAISSNNKKVSGQGKHKNGKDRNRMK